MISTVEPPTVMIDGLILNAPRTTSPQTTILTPTPIKLQQSILASNSGMSQATPTMISSTHNCKKVLDV